MQKIILWYNFRHEKFENLDTRISQVFEENKNTVSSDLLFKRKHIDHSKTDNTELLKFLENTKNITVYDKIKKYF